MFSRNADGNRNEDARRGGLQPIGTSPVRETAVSSASTEPITGSSAGDSVIAKEDRLDGTIRAIRSVRVIGQVKGKIDAPSVRIDEGAKVTADVTADEVVVAGEYSGNMTCRGRLEVRPSGRISGKIEAQRLMLHEGAAVDGEVHMFKPAAEESSVRGAINVRGGTESDSHQPATSAAEPVAAAGEPVA